MRVGVEIVPELKDECIATYMFPIDNLSPNCVRKALRRAVRRSDIDEAVLLILILKEGKAVPPEIERAATKGVCELVTTGSVVNDCIDICNPEGTKELAEAGEDLPLWLPLAAIENLNAVYRRWIPLKSGSPA